MDSIINALSEVTCEVAAIKDRVKKLEEEKKELIQKLLVMSRLDEEVVKALKSLDEKLATSNGGLEKEAAELRAVLLRMIGRRNTRTSYVD